MKGIKMILGALAAASLLFSFSANAQENNNRDENGKVVRGAYETNKAFDNTFIGIGAGINSVIGDWTNTASWGKIGLAADLNFGKWWTPAIGMRLGYHGLWQTPKVAFYGAQNANNNPAGVAPANNGAANDKFGFHYLYGALMWNISNSIGGYKETRFWDFIPYVSMGILDVTSGGIFALKNSNLEYGAGVGLVNELRLSDRVNLNLDLHMLVGRANAYTADAGQFIWFPSATLGLGFNLWKTGFDRHSTITPVVIPVPFTTDQYNALADKVAALEKENAELKDKIAALENELAPYRNLVDGQTYLYENGTFTAVDVKPGSPVTVYFDCGSTKISAREKAHLEYFASNVVDENIALSVNGYADKQTGSAKRNQYLSEQRAKAVVDYLVKAGAKEENIESAGHGATVQLFDGAEKNRVVTIEVK